MPTFTVSNTTFSMLDDHVRLLAIAGANRYECCVSRAALQALTGNEKLAAFSMMDAARRHFPAIAAVWQATIDSAAQPPAGGIWLDASDFARPPPPKPPEPPVPG